MWPINLSVRLPIVDLVSRYLTNYLIGRESIIQRITPLVQLRCLICTLCGISSRFQLLSPSERQVTHALLTRPPLRLNENWPKSHFKQSSFDLHVLGTPPAFVLSQDQTLWKIISQDLSLKIFHKLVASQSNTFACCPVLLEFKLIKIFGFSYKVLSLFNFQGPFASAFLRAPDYINTSLLLCQHFFWSFLKKFCFLNILQNYLFYSLAKHQFIKKFSSFLYCNPFNV